MDVLLATLERIGRPRGRRRLVGLAVVAASLFAFAWLRAPGAARCEDGVAAMDGVWNEQRRNDLRAAILGVDVVWAPTAANQIEAAMDAFAARWRSSHADLCAAKDDADFDAGMTCLRDDLRRAGAFVEVLLAADPRAVERAVENAAALPDPHRCAVRPDWQAASDGRAEEIRDAIATAEALLRAGRYDAAYDAALRAETLAVRSGDPGLRADALVLLGKTRSERGDWTGAETTLEEAFWLASEHGHDAAAGEAALMLVVATSESSSRYEDAKRWAEHCAIDLRAHRRRADGVGPPLRRTRQPGISARRLLCGRRALARERASVRGGGRARRFTVVDGARQSRRHARDARRVRGGRGVQRRALAIRERTLGKDHPDVAQALHTLAACVAGAGRASEALPLQRRAVQLWERSLGDDHRSSRWRSTTSARCRNSSATTRRRCAPTSARSRSARPDSAAIIPTSACRCSTSALHTSRSGATPMPARRSSVRSQACDSALGDGHDHVAYAEMAYGSQLRRDGELEEARDLLRQATAVFDATPGNPQAPHRAGGARRHAPSSSARRARRSRCSRQLWRARLTARSVRCSARRHASISPARCGTARRIAIARESYVSEAQHELANAELHGRHDAERRALLVELDAWQREH